MLQGENSLLNSYKSTMQNLEQDKKSLERKVVKLEASLQESQTNANILSNIDTSGRYIPFRFYMKLQDTMKTTLFPFFVNLKNMQWEHYFVGDARLEKMKSDKEAAEGQVSQTVLFVTFYSVRHSESPVPTQKVRFTSNSKQRLSVLKNRRSENWLNDSRKFFISLTTLERWWTIVSSTGRIKV